MEPITAEEVTELVSGNTEVWKKGAGYFQPDGTFLAHWEGDNVEGTWWVEGNVRCYDVEEWGEWCYEFFRKDGEIYTARQGADKVIPSRMVEGNQL